MNLIFLRKMQADICLLLCIFSDNYADNPEVYITYSIYIL